ncbi:MAG TPA: hypothetical protein VHJ82_07660 [Actinomycetota bacterium]|nr:hypothetical protein [Actinomycetota bacterium]
MTGGRGGRARGIPIVLMVLMSLGGPATPAFAQPAEAPCPRSAARQVYPFDQPALSNGGRMVAFTTAAALDARDRNGDLDVYLWSGRRVTRVSLDGRGKEGDGPSRHPAITPDGRFVAFQSDAQLVRGDPDGPSTDVFVRDLRRKEITQVSVGLGGAITRGESSRPSISADGRFVAFRSTEPNLVDGDENDLVDVFVRDLKKRKTVLVSVSSEGAAGDDRSAGRSRGGLDISGNGRYVVFESAASNLAPADTDGDSDIFIHDLATGNTNLVSVAFDGGDTTGSPLNVEGADSLSPSVNADGTLVAFASGAVNLVEGDANNQGPDGGYLTDVFVRNLTTDETQRVSVGTGGAEADGPSHFPSISADGGTVSFESVATNLASGDDNGEYDVFVRNLATDTTVPISVRDATPDVSAQPRRFPLGSVSAALSPDGGTVAFASDDGDLVGDDENGVFDIYTRKALGRSPPRRLATPCLEEPVLVADETGLVARGGSEFGPPDPAWQVLLALTAVLALARATRKVRLGLVALLAVGLFLPRSPSATAHHYAPIQPGGQLLEEELPCSMNFVFQERETRAAVVDGRGGRSGGGALYIGTAAHCLRDFGTDGLVGARPKIEGLGEFGTTVYGRYDLWSSRAMDFALIKIDAEKADMVSPSVRAWGGPKEIENTFNAGAPTMYYGFGTYLRNTEFTRAKAGALEYVIEESAPYEGWYVDAHVASGGDSGSPGLIGEDGEALGITVGIAAGFGEPGLELGPTAALIIDELRLAGFDVELVTAPFPASPADIAQHCAAMPVDDSGRGDGCIRSNPGP